MTAAELLEEVKGRGVRLLPEGGNLRLRPRSALSPELLDQLRQHKKEILAILSGTRPPVVEETLGGGVAAQQGSLTVADVVAMPLEEFAKARLVVEVRSEVLREAVVFASDNALVDPGERRVLYRARELRLLLGARPADLRTLHAAKKAFGATIEEC